MKCDLRCGAGTGVRNLLGLSKSAREADLRALYGAGLDTLCHVLAVGGDGRQDVYVFVFVCVCVRARAR